MQFVRVHNTSENRLLQRYHHGAPVLDLSLHSNHTVYSAGLDGHIRR